MTDDKPCPACEFAIALHSTDDLRACTLFEVARIIEVRREVERLTEVAADLLRRVEDGLHDH